MASSSKASVITEPQRVAARLRELGVSQEILHGALHAGIAASALTTLNHPPNFGGTSLWAEAVRWLRETLIPKGWRRDNSYNFPTVVNSSDTVAIAIARGDEGTGDPDAVPSTQYSRGSIMVRAIERNAFLPYEHLPAAYDGEDEDTGSNAPTWLLLHNRKDGQLVCELSFPTSINKSGFVEEWGERIVLKGIDLDPARMPILDDAPVSTPDVTVRRRRG